MREVFVDSRSLVLDPEPPEPEPPATPPPHADNIPSAPKPGGEWEHIPPPSKIKVQEFPWDDLKIVSQPPGTDIDDLPGFGYAEEAGEGVTIYVLDTGVQEHHNVSYYTRAEVTSKSLI